IASHLFVPAFERLAAPDQVDRAVLCGPHEPGARPLGHAFGGPLLERSDEGVLCELLSRPDVADEARQPGDEPGRLDPPDRFDRAMRFGGQGFVATWLLGRALSPIYTENAFTSRPSRGPDGSHRSRRRRVTA